MGGDKGEDGERAGGSDGETTKEDSDSIVIAGQEEGVVVGVGKVRTGVGVDRKPDPGPRP